MIETWQIVLICFQKFIHLFWVVKLVSPYLFIAVSYPYYFCAIICNIFFISQLICVPFFLFGIQLKDCQFIFLKNKPLVSLIFYTVFLVSILFISSLIFVISFLFNLELYFSLSSSLSCKVQMFICCFSCFLMQLFVAITFSLNFLLYPLKFQYGIFPFSFVCRYVFFNSFFIFFFDPLVVHFVSLC